MGTSFGFDFNPAVDRIRIVSNTGQNLRFNPNDGVVNVDGNLNPGTPSISAAAYTNNFAGTATTSLFAIDQGWRWCVIAGEGRCRRGGAAGLHCG